MSSESWQFYCATVLIGVLTLIYLYAKHNYSYWERKGFSYLPGCSFLFGHFKSTLTRNEFVGDFITRIYQSTSEPFIGIYGILRPILFVRDPDLIRSILIKDFNHFSTRAVHCNEEIDPLSGHLFSLSDFQKWKSLRSKLTPAFTTGKLKSMFGTLFDCGLTFQRFLEQHAENEELLDARDVAARHSTNVIASVGFGLEVDTIAYPNNDFRACGRQIFASNFSNAFRWFLFFFAPKIMSMFRIKMVNSSVEKFIMSIVEENLRYREKNNVIRKDFFQLLIQLRNTGTVQLDDEWETVIKADENQKTLTLNEMAAQSFVFYAAGFETSSTTLSFCLYELIKNQATQKRVTDEIDRVLEDHNGKITYESVSDMKYLEATIDETLRKYPTLAVLSRSCVKEYRIPGTDKVIEEGTQIYIPVMPLHMDDRYYAEPTKFIPDRFLDKQNVASRPLYLPFGDGPRHCIGLRLAKMQIKVALVMMFEKFRFELEDALQYKEIKFDPKVFLISPLQQIRLKVFKRQYSKPQFI